MNPKIQQEETEVAEMEKKNSVFLCYLLLKEFVLLKQEQTERTETEKISVASVTSCSIPLSGDKKCIEIHNS